MIGDILHAQTEGKVGGALYPAVRKTTLHASCLPSLFTPTFAVFVATCEFQTCHGSSFRSCFADVAITCRLLSHLELMHFIHSSLAGLVSHPFLLVLDTVASALHFQICDCYRIDNCISDRRCNDTTRLRALELVITTTRVPWV